MGAIVVSSAVSLDGYAEGPGGDVAAMPLDAAFNLHNAEMAQRASRLLLGARTYRQMVAYWPGQRDSADPSERAIAARYAEGLPVTVVSDALTADETGPWRDQTTVVPRAAAHRAVAALREAEGDTVVFGSRTVWADLLARGLVDELHLLVGPGTVAGDVPAFAGVPRLAVRLADVRRWEGSDSVLLSYAVARGPAGPPPSA